MQGLSLSGIWRLLKRLQLHYKRGRHYLHSPDAAYESKLVRLTMFKRLVRQQATRTAAKLVLLYEDEFTFYRQPTLAASYAPGASDAPALDTVIGAIARTGLQPALTWSVVVSLPGNVLALTQPP